jgi:hypothetical protein
MSNAELTENIRQRLGAMRDLLCYASVSLPEMPL